MTTHQFMADETLIEQIKDGNEQAFHHLYERYSAHLYRYFLRLLRGDREKSEDFLQELFLRVLEHVNQFRKEYAVKTWLYTIATNLCRNEWKKNANRAQLIESFTPWESPSSSNEDVLDRNQFQKELSKWMLTVDDMTREIVILRYYQDLTVREIAEIVSIPEGTVKSKLFYTLQSLAQKLQNYHPHKN